MMPAIQINNIQKRFGQTTALEGISLQVEEGELFGLIGPDGAGKTTLIRILMTLLLADEGEAEVMGLSVTKDYRKIRQEVGYMPGRFSLYQDLSVEENLRFFARIFGTTIEENYHLIQDIYQALEPFARRKAGKLSGGMKQKLALSCALIHKPKVLFLDEPTTGVDAVSRQEFWDMLKRLQDQGITMLVSTPYMDEASRCDRVGLIQEGKLLQVAAPKAIEEQYPWPLYAVRSQPFNRLIGDLRRYPNVHSAYPFGQRMHLATQAPIVPEELEKYLLGLEHRDISIQPITAGIEDCFIELMHQPAQPTTS
jgi:ABC-2 type transport system ATP-binding protein